MRNPGSATCRISLRNLGGADTKSSNRILPNRKRPKSASVRSRILPKTRFWCFLVQESGPIRNGLRPFLTLWDFPNYNLFFFPGKDSQREIIFRPDGPSYAHRELFFSVRKNALSCCCCRLTDAFGIWFWLVCGQQGAERTVFGSPAEGMCMTSRHCLLFVGIVGLKPLSDTRFGRVTPEATTKKLPTSKNATSKCAFN